MRGSSVTVALVLCLFGTSAWGQTTSAPPKADSATPLRAQPDPSEGEVLVAKLPPGYKVGPVTNGETTIAKVMFPEGESPERWTEILGEMAYLGMKGRSPEQFQTSIQQFWEKSCKDSTVAAESKGQENGYAFAMWTISCPLNPKTSKPEFSLFKAIQGHDNFYLVNKQFRFVPSEEQRQRWKAYVSSITVCDSRLSGSPCPEAEAGIRPVVKALDLVPLTAEKIHHLRSTANNPSGDYFLGTPENQQRIVDAFVADNSKADSVYLYIAANTAIKIGDVKDAGFLFYAAQIRRHLDSKRFLPLKGEKDLEIYVGFLNQTVGQSVNPAVVRDGKVFSAIVDMIARWNVVPADDATYLASVYGTYAVPREKWPVLGEAEKKDFMDHFGNKYKIFLSDLRNVEANNFVQDYNLYKVPHTSENDEKYQKYSQIVKKGLELQP